MSKRIHKGFIEPVFEEKAYFLGASPVPQIILQEKGDWTDSLPTGERQCIRDIETYNCTSFGTTTQIEIYMYKAFKLKENYSDRWLGIIAGTSPKDGGNDPQKVYEAVRKYGLIPEEMLPFSYDIKTVEDYYSFKGANEAECRAEGQRWLSQFDFKHEWVFDKNQSVDEKINNMKNALKFSPLAIAVYAWDTDNTGKYVRQGNDNHWTVCYNVPSIFEIFDSYESFIKYLREDFNFFFCKRIHIEKKVPQEQNNFWFVTIAQGILSFVKDILKLDLEVLKKKL